jgi:hypothetical protein
MPTRLPSLGHDAGVSALVVRQRRLRLRQGLPLAFGLASGDPLAFEVVRAPEQVVHVIHCGALPLCGAAADLQLRAPKAIF